MDLNQDFRDLLAALEKSRAKYLLVGGYAVAVHAKPRYTKDIDIWIDEASENVKRVCEALREFGAPGQAITDLETSGPDEIVWFGAPPVRVDILKRISGLHFDPAYSRRAVIELGEIRAFVISREDLIVAKQAAGRPQDLVDADVLSQAAPAAEERKGE